MGFIERLFSDRDWTRGWVADPLLKIEFDFAAHALCGVKIGEPFDGLSKLGRAEDAAEGSYRFYSQGLCFEEERGNIVYFGLFFDSPADPKYSSFRGPLSSDTREEDLVKLFGAPYWRDQDEDEIILFYEYGDIEHQFELGPEGRLRAVGILTPPLLSREEQRRSYRVAKPWPPA